jgi:hypothetical protein
VLHTKEVGSEGGLSLSSTVNLVSNLRGFITVRFLVVLIVFVVLHIVVFLLGVQGRAFGGSTTILQVGEEFETTKRLSDIGLLEHLAIALSQDVGSML